MSEVECDEARTWCEALRQVRGAGMRVIAQAPPETPDAIVAAFAPAAAPLGYVAVDAHLDMPEEERRRLWHRHVVLVHRGPPSPASVRWIRELAMASPRAHAVVMMPSLVDRVHEAGLDATVGRMRRTDLEPHGPARRVLAHGRRALAAGPGLLARSRVVATMADAWVSEGAFDAATAALAGVDVECRLRAVPVPPWIRERQAEVACWLGQWDVAARCATGASHVGWMTVVACARRDWETVRAIPAAAPEVSPGWSALVAAVRAAAGGDAPGVCAAVDELHRSAGPPRWRDVLALECLRMAGADDNAESWRRRWGRRPRGPAESVLWRYATRHSGSDTAADLDAQVRRLGADGIRRWGMGRQNMQMWAGVSSLLHLVHEADDAGSALRQGCRWAREYTGVDVVGVVSEAGQVLACDPDDPRRLGAPGEVEHAEAVRYGGTSVGRVVLQGVARDGAEARAVAAALATACAPAMRARLDELLVTRAGEAAGDLLGSSPLMTALRSAVARAAASSFPVLIEGESGTGKELVARAVHRLSPRRDRRWAAVNCAALTDELLEAELFGHTRGAFTGAVGPRAGLLEDAHEGTLFLDEVAELSPRGQAKLLRVLQEGEIRRVGENHSRRVDVRLVTATNRPLDTAVREGGYREDLVFRLAVIRLRVPPLRDRIEDVPLLAHAFWQAAGARVATRAMLTPEAVAALCRYRWPGNVRELQNVIAALAVAGPSRGRVCARQVGAVLAERAAPGATDVPVSLAMARRLSDHRVVSSALARHAGRRTAAARELGVSRQGLAKLITRLNVQDPRHVQDP